MTPLTRRHSVQIVRSSALCRRMGAESSHAVFGREDVGMADRASTMTVEVAVTFSLPRSGLTWREG